MHRYNLKKSVVIILIIPLILIQMTSASLAAKGDNMAGQGDKEHEIENKVILEKELPQKQGWWSQNWYWVVGGIVLAAGGAAAAAGGGGGGSSDGSSGSGSQMEVTW